MDTFSNKTATTTGLVYGYYGGVAIVNGIVTIIADGTITLPTGTTNYIEHTYAGVVTSNTSGFTPNGNPMAMVSTVGGHINMTTIVDYRTIAAPLVPYPVNAAESGVATGIDVRYPLMDVRRYGAIANTGATWNTYTDALTGTDAASAFNAAMAVALVRGGVVVVPAGQYYLNGQWTASYAGSFVCVEISGYGAELFAGPTVTGSAIKITGAPQPEGMTVRGLTANHRGNANVSAFIELNGSSHSTLEDITVQLYDVKAGYAAVLLSCITPGDDNTACFWTKISKLRVRERSGGEGADATHGIWLKGPHNATEITSCSFTSCINGISLTGDGSSAGELANGVVIAANAFEGIPCAVNIEGVRGSYWPDGLRVSNNRTEVCPTFFSMTMVGSGADPSNPSSPTFLYGNFCVNGSVTNWIVSPSTAWVCALEMVAYGAVHAGTRLQSYNDNFRVVLTGGGKQFIITNESGYSNWYTGHLQLGEDPTNAAHVWADTGTGLLHYKYGSAPTSAVDGVVIGGGSAIPAVDAAYDLGSSSKHWRDLFASRDAAIGGKLGVNGAAPVAKQSIGTTVAATVATNVSPYGFLTQAQADALVTKVNAIDALLRAFGLGQT